jgi:hypothetical protein
MRKANWFPQLRFWLAVPSNRVKSTFWREYNKLRTHPYFEVLAVKSHGGSIPPPRTDQTPGNSGVFPFLGSMGLSVFAKMLRQLPGECFARRARRTFLGASSRRPPAGRAGFGSYPALPREIEAVHLDRGGALFCSSSRAWLTPAAGHRAKAISHRNYLDSSNTFDPLPRTFDPLPRRFDPLPRTFDPLPRRFDPLPRRFGPLPRRFDPLPRRFDPLPRRFDPLPRRFDPLPRRTWDQAGDKWPSSWAARSSCKRRLAFCVARSMALRVSLSMGETDWVARRPVFSMR